MVTDGADNITGTATLDITPVADAPTTMPVILSPIDEDSGARLITLAELLANASDAEGDALTATGLTIAPGRDGMLTDNGNGTWTYTPAANDDTGVRFNYIITAGADSIAGEASFNILGINDVPTTTPVALTAIAEDSVRLITQAELLANACLLYTSPSPRDLSTSRMPSSA